MSSKAVPGGNPAVRVAFLGVVDEAAGLADPALEGLGGAHRRELSLSCRSCAEDYRPVGSADARVGGTSERSASPAEPNTGPPVTPRQAASVILLRGGAEKLELLLVKRTPKARFMGGVWVFPGGAVDAEEGDGDAAHRMAGDPRAARGGLDLARGSRRARQVLPLDHPGGSLDPLRHPLLPGPLPEGQEPEIDGEECVDLGWFTPEGASTPTPPARSCSSSRRSSTSSSCSEFASVASCWPTPAAARCCRSSPTS